MSREHMLTPAVETALSLALLVLLLSLMVGLYRAWQGPTTEDRFCALLLISSGGIGIMFLLALLLQLPALYDTALVLSLLAVVISVALTRRQETKDG